MTGGRWPGHQIREIVSAESGASLGELAERMGLSYPEVTTVVWRLYGAKLVDTCWGFVVAPPRADEGRRSA